MKVHSKISNLMLEEEREGLSIFQGIQWMAMAGLCFLLQAWTRYGAASFLPRAMGWSVTKQVLGVTCVEAARVVLQPQRKHGIAVRQHLCDPQDPVVVKSCARERAIRMSGIAVTAFKATCDFG